MPQVDIGIGPSPPPIDLCSNCDAANARAAVQANIVDHRSGQACSALFRNTGISERRVLPRGGGDKSKFQPTNVLQPLLPGPPILFCSWANQLVVCAFLPSAGRLESNSIDPWSSSFGGAITMMNRNQGRVHCKLCAAEQREAFRNHFYAAPIVHLKYYLFILAQPAQKELTMSALNPGRRLVLPPTLCATSIPLLNVSRRWPNTFEQCVPRRWFKPFHPHQTLPCRRTRWASFQLINNCPGHEVWRARIMATQLAQKAQALVRAALRIPNPPLHNGRDPTSLANSSH